MASGQGGAAPAGDKGATPQNERLPEGDSDHDDTNDGALFDVTGKGALDDGGTPSTDGEG